MSFQAAVAYFAFGWAAGLGTAALAARSARGAWRAQLLRDAPPGWRSYAPVSRPRHANSDNGAPMTARPPIEPQGQAPVRPQPHGGRQVWADGTPVVPPPPIEPQGQNRVRKIGQTLAKFNDELNNSLIAGYSEDFPRATWPELLRAPMTARPPIEPQGQAPVKPAFPPPRKIREGFTAEKIQADNLRPWSELEAAFLAHQANVARIEAEQASAPGWLYYWASFDTDSQAIANAAARRSGIWQPQANKAVQQLADEGDRDPAEAVINDASSLWMRHDKGRATGQGDPLPPPANP